MPEPLISSRTEVTVRTQNFPNGRASWEVDLPNNQPEEALLYNNLAVDLVAAVMAKLGVEFSKYLVDRVADPDAAKARFEQALKPVIEATTTTSV